MKLDVHVQRTRGFLAMTARFLALLCMVAVIVLSTLPGVDRPHTGFSGNLEHFVAYLGTAFFVSGAFSRIRGAKTVLILSIASASFEIMQIYIPGRGPGVDNWMASTAGAIAGVLCARLALMALCHLNRASAAS